MPRAATMATMRKFNTEGPVRAHRHYQIAPLSRIDLEEVLGLIRDEKYFVLHARGRPARPRHCWRCGIC